MNSTEEKTLIGWREWIALPELGIPAVKAKVDTGARTSCLHAFNVESFRKNGNLFVRFQLPPLQRRSDILVTCESQVVDKRVVTDSGGHDDLRFVILTPITLGDATWPVELTLKNRETMIFRMLLGRTAIDKRVIIDPERSFISKRLYTADLAAFYPGYRA